VAYGLAHDGGEGGAELLSDGERHGALVAELSGELCVHLHANFKHDEVVNLGFERC